MENKIQVFANEKFRIRCYVDKDGTIMFNAEDVARYLGFTQIKNGVEYVRWETINRYVSEIKAKSFSQNAGKFPVSLGKDDYIPENLVYRLAMKANNENAEKFQAWIADEVVPSIREKGYYVLPGVDVAHAADSAAELLEKVDRMLICAELTNLDRLRNQILREVIRLLTGKSMI